MENKTEKKMTYVGAIDFVLGKYEKELPVEIVEKFGKMKEQFNKKKSGVSAKKLEENKEMLEALYTIVAEANGKAMKAAEIAHIWKAGATPQKVAPYLKQLVDAEKLNCEKVKGSNVYTLASAVAVEEENEVEG